MGIVNVTPDSFLPSSRVPDCAAAVALGRSQVELGAAVIDVGGESTRPGATGLAADEERRRVIPVIERLAAAVEVPISVDTYKAEVARAAVAAGATLVNDVSGGLFDPGMPATIAELEVPVIVGHVPHGARSIAEVHAAPREAEPLAALLRDLGERLAAFEAAGVRRERLLVDPGIGFGKGARENVAILRNLAALGVFERPIVIGVSRKSFLDALVGVERHRGAGDGRDRTEGPEGRLAASLAAQVLAASRGAALVRTHDVRESVSSLAVVDAVLQ
jgi:dihydropteroate synthase